MKILMAALYARYAANFVRSAMEPDTMVAAVAQNTVWKMMKTPIGSPLNIPSASANVVGLKNPLIPTIPFQSVPCIRANPKTKKSKLPRTKSIIFFIKMLPVFLALVKPASHIAKPACIKYTRIAPIMVHIMFMRRPDASATSMPFSIKVAKSIKLPPKLLCE